MKVEGGSLSVGVLKYGRCHATLLDIVMAMQLDVANVVYSQSSAEEDQRTNRFAR